MIARVSGWVGNRRFWRAAALVLCAGVVMTACGGGGGGGPDTTPPGLVGRPGVPIDDIPPLDTPGTAATLIVDGPPISGAINPKVEGDTDFYTFRGVAGITYTLQIFGFATPRPYLTTDDGFEFFFRTITENLMLPTDRLEAMILSPDQVTQLANSSGTQGGTPYDIPDAGEPLESHQDSRLLWLCPLTGDYYVRVRHVRTLTQDGNYVIKLASAQNFNVVGRQRSGATDFTIFNLIDFEADPPEFKFGGVAFGLIGPAILDVEPLGDGTIDVDFLLGGTNHILNGGGGAGGPVGVSEIIFDMEEDPEAPALHLHFGYPDLIKTDFGGFSQFVDVDTNLQPSSMDDPHPFVLDITVNVLERSSGGRGVVYTETYVPGPDGEPIRVPVTIESEEIVLPDGRQFIQGSARIFANASRGGADPIELDAGVFRLAIAYPWYLDLHFTDNLELWSEPVAVGPSFGGIYGVFESTMPMSAGNVVTRTGETPSAELQRVLEAEVARGSVPFSVFYDSALQVFQIEVREWDEGLAKFLELSCIFRTPDCPFPPPRLLTQAEYDDFALLRTGAEAFVGLSIKVHRGGPFETGPAFIDLGTVPDPGDPISFRFDPGIRRIVKKLTDAEATALRDQFYNGGFYVQVSSDTAPNGLLRAEGFLNLQINPNDGTVREAGADDSGFGTINFASEYAAGGAVVVTLNGSAIGALIDFVPAGVTPECGAFLTSATVAAELPVARYAYSATAEDGTVWEGHVTVEAGSCETIVLTAP